MRAVVVTIVMLMAAAASSHWLSSYLQYLLVLFGIYGTLALSWNILGGMAGQVSLGLSLFIGLGAYLSTALYLFLGLSPWLGLVSAVLAGGALGALAGVLVFSRGLAGVYFSLATLALAEVALYIVSNVPFLGAANGLSIPSAPGFANFQFSERSAYCVLSLAILAVALGINSLIAWSTLGVRLRAVRDNESAAAAAGIDVIGIKIITSAISGAMAAATGPLYAQYLLFIDPDSVLGLGFSIDALIYAFVGGMHSLLGPLLGVVVLLPLSEVLHVYLGGQFSGAHLLVYGLVLIVIIRFCPDGIAGLINRVANRSAK
jgi:branched-chain amino acid transport system permease protein